MMYGSKTRQRIHQSAKFVKWACGLGIVILSITLKINPDDYWDPFPKFFRWLAPYTPFLILGCAVVAPFAGWIQKLASDQNRWRNIHRVLDDLRDKCFVDVDDDPLDHHRATLFKHTNWRIRFCRWPWSG
jgi:hypothetical protein